jgi:hypothetical protein
MQEFFFFFVLVELSCETRNLIGCCPLLQVESTASFPLSAHLSKTHYVDIAQQFVDNYSPEID